MMKKLSTKLVNFLSSLIKKIALNCLIKILPPPSPNLLKTKYFKLFKRGYSLVELLTVVGILGALSTVAITQFGKYQKTAQERTLDSTTKWNTANCINAPNVNQCYCEKGLAELVGLKPSDCCPEGRVKNALGTCVIFQALNTKAKQKNSGNPNQKSPNQDEEEPSTNPSPLPTCDLTFQRDYRTFFSNPHCNCPEGRVWHSTGGIVFGKHCVCQSFQDTDSTADCYLPCLRYQNTDPNGACYHPCVTYQRTNPGGACYWADCPTDEQGNCGPSSCPSGQALDGAKCVPISSCSGGQVAVRGVCKCPNPFIQEYDTSKKKCVPRDNPCPIEGLTLNSEGTNCVCPEGKIYVPGSSGCVDMACPGTGHIRDTRNGDCYCPSGKVLHISVRNPSTNSCLDSCPQGTYEANNGICYLNSNYAHGTSYCPRGKTFKNGVCVSGTTCSRGYVFYSGKCNCLYRDPNGECVSAYTQLCDTGERYNYNNGGCDAVTDSNNE